MRSVVDRNVVMRRITDICATRTVQHTEVAGWFNAYVRNPFRNRRLPLNNAFLSVG